MDWKTMQAHFDEEVADAMKYKSLAEKVDGGDRQMLMDMAREECTHAKHICQMMYEHGEGKTENREQLKRLREKLNFV